MALTLPLLLILFSVPTLTGCRTISQESVTAFSLGVTQAKEQTDLAFKSFNELTRGSIVDFAARQPTLNEKNFLVVLEPESVAVWERAFSALESYAQHLAILTSPNLTQEFKDSALRLAEEVKTTGEALKSVNLIPNAPQVPASLAAGFTKLGDILIRARAQAKAQTVLREADPQIQDLLQQMAQVIGPTQKEGLRGTVWAHWQQQKAEKTPAFLTAGDIAGKRSVVVEFLDLRDHQLMHDAALASLQRSLNALATVHNALAVGDALGASGAVGIIKAEIEDTKKLLLEFQKRESGTTN